MTILESLQKAIAAHSGWKARLRTALGRGKFDGDSASVRADNQCEFGKWLYSKEIAAAERQTAYYSTVRDLHAQFHQEAAKVVDLINTGDKDKAETAIGIGSSYVKVSSALTEAMVKWRNSLS